MKKSLITLAVLLFVLAWPLACAQEEGISMRVELFHEGVVVEQAPMLAATFSASMFDNDVASQLNASVTRINVSRYALRIDEFYASYQRLLNSRPELFHVSGGFTYYTSGGYVTSIIPNYLYSGSELTRMRRIYNEGVNEIVAYAQKADSDVGRLLRANDYICANYEYDKTYSIYSPELFFENGAGVCQAYMLVYRAVLNKLGITNITVSSDEINHTWNMVLLDGEWYHIDVTWNDPISDTPLRAKHSNFLLSDDGITATGHTGWDDSWEGVCSADSKKYDDFFWRKLNQVAPMNGDLVYYVDSSYQTTWRTVYTHNLASGQQSELLSYNYGYGTYYYDYNPIWVAGDRLYYAVRSDLYSMPLSGGVPSLIYTTGSSGQWIWYPFQSGSALDIYIASKPNGVGIIDSCELELSYVLTMNETAVRMDVGETIQLCAQLSPALTDEICLSWSSGDSSIAHVSETGEVTAVAGGVVKIKASYGTGAEAECTVIVTPEECLRLPADVSEIQSEAFRGTGSGMIELPEGTTVIGSKAFADSDSLLLVNLPQGLTEIAADAFSGSRNVTLICTAGSKGEAYAIAQGILYVILP